MSEGPSYEGQHQWIMLALLGGDITAREAAAKTSVLEKAEARGEACPDVRFQTCASPGESD